MSAENVQAFIEKLNTDETFRDQIINTGSDEARLQNAKNAGFEFTLEEFWSAAEQLAARAESKELTEEQLETVAGGVQTLAKASKLMEEEGIFGSGNGRSSNLKWENIVL